MSNMTKLDFRLVPTKGVTSGGGYRAEFIRKNEESLDIDTVIAEAQENGAFYGMPASRVRCDLEAFFDSMIKAVLKDGKTRKLDGYLELSLKIHGNFENKTDNFDESKHSLDLVLKPLSALRSHPTDIQPVNVNRIKQYRLSYITAADGLHKNHQIVYGQDFIIRGSNLTLPDNNYSGVFCTVQLPGVNSCAEAPILSKSDSEIRCSWPAEYGPETKGCRFYAMVSKITDIKATVPDIDRTIRASILPG